VQDLRILGRANVLKNRKNISLVEAVSVPPHVPLFVEEIVNVLRDN